MCESLHNALPGQEARYSHKNASGDVDVEDVEEGQGDVSFQLSIEDTPTKKETVFCGERRWLADKKKLSGFQCFVLLLLPVDGGFCVCKNSYANLKLPPGMHPLLHNLSQVRVGMAIRCVE